MWRYGMGLVSLPLRPTLLEAGCFPVSIRAYSADQTTFRLLCYSDRLEE